MLEEGVILEGTVKNITDYGAFVDLGGIDGLLHVTDMSWGARRPSVRGGQRRRPREGRRAQVRPRARARVARHEADHARSVEHASASASRSARACTARCVSLTDYGAFVELEPGHRGPGARLRDVVDEARDASVEGARGRAGGRRPGARRRPAQPPHLARPEADRAEPVGDGAHQSPGRQPHRAAR